MAIADSIITKPPALRMDRDGTIRIGGTRVTLDTIVEAWRQGTTAEDIARQYDALTMADVYETIGFILRNQAEVDAYLEEGRQRAEEARIQTERITPPDGFKAELLARHAHRSSE